MARDTAPMKSILQDILINDTLFSKLLQHSTRRDGTLKPEGKTRVTWIVRFVKEYGYDSRQIDVEVPAGRIGRAADSLVLHPTRHSGLRRYWQMWYNLRHETTTLCTFDNRR